jgi:hypothetical protein
VGRYNLVRIVTLNSEIIRLICSFCAPFEVVADAEWCDEGMVVEQMSGWNEWRQLVHLLVLIYLVSTRGSRSIAL